MYRRASYGAMPVPKVFSLSEDLAAFSKQQLSIMPCQRTGIMAAFTSFEQFERYNAHTLTIRISENFVYVCMYACVYVCMYVHLALHMFQV